MKRGQDIAVEFPGLYLVHHNLPGNEVALHLHAEHLLFIPLQGEIAVQLSEKELRCGPGKMIYLPPKTNHAFRSCEKLGERIIGLISTSAWKKASGKTHSPRILSTSQLCKELLFHLLLHPKTKQAGSLVQVFTQTLNEALEESPSHLKASAKDARVVKVLDQFEAGLGEGINLDAMARKAGLSTRSLNRLFLTELGMTPKQVLIQYRVQKAQELLAQGGRSVTDVAFEVGYQSLSQFIQVFRNLTGLLPSEVARHRS